MRVRSVMFLTAATVPLISGATVSGALAQEDQRQLDLIVVEARKRAENLQDVPVVVQAFTAETLEAYATSDFRDLGPLVSGLSIQYEGPTQPHISLRGINGDAINALADYSVTTNFDGVPHSSNQLYRFGLFDVEAVEVLKGPQALYYGKNSPGGIISMRTKNPTDELFVELQGGYEIAAERVYGHAIISGPLGENWGVRLGARYAGQEGFFDNVFGDDNPALPQPIDQHGPNFNERVFQGTLRGEYDAFEVTIKGLHANRDGGQYNPNQAIRCNDIVPVVNPGSDCTLNDTFSTQDLFITPFAPSRFAADEPFHDYKLTQLSMNATLDLGENWSAHSITGWVDVNNRIFGTVGPYAFQFFVTGTGFGFAQDINVETISQELRFEGDYDRLRLMFGGFYDDRDTSSGANLWLDPFLRVLPDGVTTIDSNSWSVFGQVEYDLTDQLSLSVGARYSEEDRSSGGENLESAPVLGTPLVAPAGPYRLDPDEISANDLSPEVTLTYQPSNDVTIFASYKEGFKSGGFNSSQLDRFVTTIPFLPPVDDAFDQETARGGEAGIKTELNNNTLRLNLAAYYYEFDDLQVTTFVTDPATNIVTVGTANAAKSRTTGVELDALWVTPVDGLNATLNVGYNNAKYLGEFLAECSEYQLYFDATGCNVDADNNPLTSADQNNPAVLVAGTGFDAQDFGGTPLENAPKWSGSVGLNYSRDMGNDMTFRANGLLFFTSSFWANGSNQDPAGIQDAYATLNLSAGLSSQNGGWSLDVIGRNMTDTDAFDAAFDLTASGSPTQPDLFVANRNPPRQIFLQLTLSPTALFN